MRFKKLDLLTLLISLFTLGACENPTGIGLDIDPNLALNAQIVDTSTVLTKLLKEDSVVSNFTERSVLGYMDDTEFGKTTANMAMALTLPSANIRFGTNPVLDSAVLILPYGGLLYGDSTNYTVEVRQLNELLYFDTQRSYFSNKKWSFTPTLLASKNFIPSYRDSVRIQDIRAGRSDTVKKVIPQLRIPLNNSFITTKIINADSASLVSNKAFADYFKGLYVSLNKTGIGVNSGAAILFDMISTGDNAARVQLFYKTTNSTGARDTTSVSFPISGSSGHVATEVTWDVAAPVQTALNSTSQNSALLYFKGLAGTKTSVKFPYITKLKSLGKNIVINRAELIFSVQDNSDDIFEPLPLLRVYKWDIANQPALIPDENPSDTRFLGQGLVGGLYNKTTKSYTINVTGHIQDLVNGAKDYGTFITTYDLIGGTNRLSFPQRSIVGGGSNSSIKTRLKIYYTDQK